jgi:hypothetical protein
MVLKIIVIDRESKERGKDFDLNRMAESKNGANSFNFLTSNYC